MLFGQNPFGWAKSVGTETSDAAEFMEAHFARYAGLDKFFKTLLAQCRENGYVSNTLGRRRKVQGMRDPSRRGDSRPRNLPERTAINTVIQGSAADLIKRRIDSVMSVHAPLAPLARGQGERVESMSELDESILTRDREYVSG